MNANQEAKLTMYRAVEQHCDDNSAITGTVTAFQTALDDFKAKIAALISTEQLLGTPLKGIAVDKTVLKQSLCQQAADVASLVYAFAAATGNNTLLEEVNFPITKLLRLRDDQLAPRCQDIYDISTANMPGAKDYGLKQPMLDGLQTAITGYAAQTPKPRLAVSERKTHNANITTLIKEADAILKNQIDKMMVSFKTDHPDFVSEYESNRHIIDPSTTSTKLSGIVTLTGEEKPIKNATVTVTGTSGQATGTTRSTTTSATGKYTLKPLPPGDYTITITAPGYKNYEETQVNAKLGNNNHLDVEMETI